MIRNSTQYFLFLLIIFTIFITCKAAFKSNKRKNVNKSRESENSISQKITANINETVVLGCNLEFPDNGSPVPYVIQWQKLNVKIPIFIWYDGYPPHTGDGYQGRTTLSGQASLQLSNVQESDQGWYECKVFFVNRPPELPKNGTWVHLDVHAPPHFKQRPPEVVYIKVGESINLSCEAQATPAPTLQWFKDGRPLHESPNLIILPGSSELQIVNIQQNDIGEYQCLATNREGSIKATTKLIIAGPAVITQQPTNLTKLEGDKAELTCEAKALPSNITYKWYFNGVSISQLSSLDVRAVIRSDGTLQIHPVSAEDTGIYTCEVFNGIGVPEMQSAYLNVQFPARVSYSPTVQYLPAGMSGIIRCYVEANPPANLITWTKDRLPFEPNSLNGVISLNNGSLFFQRVTMDNQGMYKCTPSNEYGTTPSGNVMEVLVKEPPVLTTKPNDVYQQSVNSDVHTSCEGNGLPKPTISWRRADNVKLPKDRTMIHGGNFTLKSLRKEDHGTYECVVSNEIATLVSTFVILVDSTTPHAPANVHVNTSAQAATVTWQPSYDGGYEQTYTIWYRMADQGDSDWKSIRVYPEGSTTFTLYNLLPNTFYEFQVYSRNLLGDGLPSPIIRAKTKEIGAKPDPPRNVTIQRVSSGYAISWLKPKNSSTTVSYYNIEYKEGKESESKIWGPVKSKENSYIVKLKPGESYRIRVFAHSITGVGTPSVEIRYDVPGPLTRHNREKAIAAGVVGGILFFIAAIVLSVCSVKLCNERKRRKAEKAYMMVTCPIMDARNGPHSHTGSPVPLKQYAKNRISSLVNKIFEELYYLTGWLPNEFKAKQQIFICKQKKAFEKYSKINQKTSNNQSLFYKNKVNSKDFGGFDEWDNKNKSLRSNQSLKNYPVPPMRKSKLLSAAIMNNNSIKSRIIPSSSPVIATISSPNSKQTLQIRSHLLLHQPGDIIQNKKKENFSKMLNSPNGFFNPSNEIISPIPHRPVPNFDYLRNYNLPTNQNYRSAPTLPSRHGLATNSGTFNTNQTSFTNFEPSYFSDMPHQNEKLILNKNFTPSYFSYKNNNPLNSSELNSLSRVNNSNNFQSKSFIFNESLVNNFDNPTTNVFLDSPRYSSSSKNNSSQRLFLGSEENKKKSFINNQTKTPFFKPINSFLNLNSCYNKLGIPSLTNRVHMPYETNENSLKTSFLNPEHQNYSNISNIDPLANESFFFSSPQNNLSSSISFNQQKESSDFLHLYLQDNKNYRNFNEKYFNHPDFISKKISKSYPESVKYNPYLNKSLFENLNNLGLPCSPVGSELHRLETIKKMRLAALAKEKYSNFNESIRDFSTPQINSYPKRIRSDSQLMYNNMKFSSLKCPNFENRFKKDLSTIDKLKQKFLYFDGASDENSEQKILEKKKILLQDIEKHIEQNEIKKKNFDINHLYLDSSDNDSFYLNIKNRNLEKIEKNSNLEDFEADEEEIETNSSPFSEPIYKKIVKKKSKQLKKISNNQISNFTNDEIIDIKVEESCSKMTNPTIKQINKKFDTNEDFKSGRESFKFENFPSSIISKKLVSDLHANNDQNFVNSLERNLEKKNDHMIIKSNSSSSGFASRTFSITGSLDKCPTPSKINQYPQSFMKKKERKIFTDVSADENYEFDHINSPQLFNFKNKNFHSKQKIDFEGFYEPEIEESSSVIQFDELPIKNFSSKQQRFEDLIFDKSCDENFRIDFSKLITPNQSCMSEDNFEDYLSLDDIKITKLHQIMKDEVSLNKKDRSLEKFKNFNKKSNKYHKTMCRSFNNKTEIRKKDFNRSVFSDSEIYDNQLITRRLTTENDKSFLKNLADSEENYLSSNYWKRIIRCEKLKQEFKIMQNSNEISDLINAEKFYFLNKNLMYTKPSNYLKNDNLKNELNYSMDDIDVFNLKKKLETAC